METVTPLKNWRLENGLTAEAAASKLNVTLPMWSRWENQKRAIPPQRVLAIEEVTGISRHILRPDIFGPANSEVAA